ncbi:MAG: hypothetical protein M1815_000828 [Lichina confinis]|nr:MAG: hypothetical protein M1815_000828 [Lichina confinis]
MDCPIVERRTGSELAQPAVQRIPREGSRFRAYPVGPARLWNPVNHAPRDLGPFCSFVDDRCCGGTPEPGRRPTSPSQGHRRRSLCSRTERPLTDGGVGNDEVRLVSSRGREPVIGKAQTSDILALSSSSSAPFSPDEEKRGLARMMLGDPTLGAARSAESMPYRYPPETHAQDPRSVASADPERGIRLDPQAAGRAALPVSQSNRSQTSIGQDQNGGGGGGTNDAAAAAAAGGGNGRAGTPDEVPWGPFHPCFPHPNPHVPLSSPLSTTTRIIRIKRDWMVAGDLAPTFSNLYPEVLDPIFPEDQFRLVIDKLNRDLVHIFSPWSFRSWLDIFLGILTLWLWDDLGLSDVKRRLSALETWLERWNDEIGAKEGVRIIPLRRTAYLSVSHVLSSLLLISLHFSPSLPLSPRTSSPTYLPRNLPHQPTTFLKNPQRLTWGEMQKQLDIQIPDPHLGVDIPESIGVTNPNAEPPLSLQPPPQAPPQVPPQPQPQRQASLQPQPQPRRQPPPPPPPAAPSENSPSLALPIMSG